MSDHSRAKSTHHADADGTKVEDDRQLTELLLQNRVSLKPATSDKVHSDRAPLSARIRAGLLLFVMLPLTLLAYFSTRIEEDDFYA